VHVELHTDDGDAAVAFLAQLVGWREGATDPGYGSYRVLELGGRIGGGVVPCGVRPAVWMPYVLVDDGPGSTRLAERMGCDVLVGPREGRAGWRSVIATPASGLIGLWQPKP
jgi:predicted enzyme related to lactoylglutathione lyase